MNYKLTNDTLKTKRTEIGVSIINGHVLFHVKAKKFSKTSEAFVSFRVQSSITGDLTNFERRVVLIDAYRKLSNSKDKDECKKLLDDNYAGVFGTRWE